MEDAANKIVNYLYDNIADSSGGKANALVRFYKTHPYGQLDLGLQGFAQGILGSAPSDDTNCLTMLATMGDKHDWKSRSKSNGHRAIPLASTDMAAGIPMISRLLTQFGLDVGTVMRPDPMLIGDLSDKDLQHLLCPRGIGQPLHPSPRRLRHTQWDQVGPGVWRHPEYRRTLCGDNVLQSRHPRRRGEQVQRRGGKCEGSRGALCRQQSIRLTSNELPLGPPERGSRSQQTRI